MDENFFDDLDDKELYQLDKNEKNLYENFKKKKSQIEMKVYFVFVYFIN